MVRFTVRGHRWRGEDCEKVKIDMKSENAATQGARGQSLTVRRFQTMRGGIVEAAKSMVIFL